MESAVVDHRSLQNSPTDCIYSRVRIVEGDSYMLMSFISYYETTQAMRHAWGDTGMREKRWNKLIFLCRILYILIIWLVNL